MGEGMKVFVVVDLCTDAGATFMGGFSIREKAEAAIKWHKEIHGDWYEHEIWEEELDLPLDH